MQATAFASTGRGNVAVIFALSLLPMIGVVGLGIDVARTLSARTSLQGAADAGALAAATEAEATLQSGGSISTAQYAGVVAGQQMFYANATKVGRWIGAVPTPTVSVNPGSANITAFVSYSANVPTTFGGMFGTRTFALNGTAASSLAMPKYLNISVVTDISQSMGLAATSAGQSQLSSLTGGCVFGCHVYQSGQSGALPFEAQAHAAGIQLRIDVIRQATQNMIQTAQQLSTSTPYISFGIYTLQGGNNTTDSYGNKADGQPLATLSSPSTSYSSLYTAAGNIDLGHNNSNGIGDTNYNQAMTTLTSTVAASGNGVAGSPQQFVFLMTDGVQDVWASSQSSCPSGTIGWNGSHCTRGFDATTCTALKNKGVTVGVIYTTYLPIPGVSSYETLVAPFIAQLPTSLQSCASPGWYYEASDANDIQVAINALFARATGHGVPDAVKLWHRSPTNGQPGSAKRRGLLGRLVRRIGSDRRGSSAVEFGLIATPFFGLIFAIFEVGYTNFENEMLAYAVNAAARAMLTGSLQTANVSSASQFVSQYLCQTNGRTLPSNFVCNNLIIDVRPSTTFASGDTANDFYKSSTNKFCPGQPGQIMVMRIAYPLPAIFPLNLFSSTGGVVTDVPNLPGRYHILMGAALFEEENYAGSYTSPAGC